MENIIKIKTTETEELWNAVRKCFKSVRVNPWEENKGKSSFIVTTNDLQALFNLGTAFGVELASSGKRKPFAPQDGEKAIRGKGNDKKHPAKGGS